MEGEHGKIDMICPSFVTPFKPGEKKSWPVSNDIDEKKHLYFCPLFLSFDINAYSSRHDHETPDVNYLLSSIIICGRHHFFFHLF